MEDIEVLDEGLKLFMDGDGQPRQQSSRAGPLSWRRVSEAYLRPLVRLVERVYRLIVCMCVFGLYLHMAFLFACLCVFL